MSSDQDRDIEATPFNDDSKSAESSSPLKTRSRKARTLALIESTAVTSFMTMVTIYALYSDDVRVLAFDKSDDNAFIVFSSVAFFLFVIEIGLQCWCRDDYIRIPSAEQRRGCVDGATKADRYKCFQSFVCIGSFYFWLDLMATLSMVFEIPWLNSYSVDGVDGNLDSARAGKASRAGAKAAKIFRVVRMIRLVRLVKLYKYFSEKKQHKKEGSGCIVPDKLGNELEKMPPESHVGAEMSDRTTKKVIVGILIMLVVIPLLQVEDLEYANEFGMHMVLKQRVSDHGSNIAINNGWKGVEAFFINTTSCVEMTYTGFEDGSNDEVIIPEDRVDPSTLRHNEKTVITISDTSAMYALTAAFDVSQRVDEEALLGILLTSFVIMLLAVGTMTFSRDVNSLVILPIEKMVQLVREISANPLGKNFSLSPDELKGTDDGMETTLLLRTISKIAGLMRVGFGEAGAEIIGKNLNMSSDINGGSSMNLLGNGTKILSIFGFVDVRNFTDTTECLQEEVMLFVNRIAHILHSLVVQCDGAANKNIGDAFLLTWKINPNNLGSCNDHNYAGDKALYSLLKTMVEMNRHEDFICNFSPTSLGALYERMPGYKCRIGCGLHFGWAVEGAIGSDKKIDASYISPHVNWAEFLESSTKEYGVPILLSEPFFKLLSPSVKKYCRQVDNIKKSVHDEVTGLYTYDANLNFEREPTSNFEIEERIFRNQNVKGSRQAASFISLDRRRSSSFFRRLSEDNSMNTTDKANPEKPTTATTTSKALGEAPDIVLQPFHPNLWDEDMDMVNLRLHFRQRTRQRWEKGINSFIEGDWNTAAFQFKEILKMTNGQDGPSQHLLNKMEMYSFKVPVDWQGFRHL